MFDPWVGPYYAQAPVKLLVLGESRYVTRPEPRKWPVPANTVIYGSFAARTSEARHP